MPTTRRSILASIDGTLVAIAQRNEIQLAWGRLVGVPTIFVFFTLVTATSSELNGTGLELGPLPPFAVVAAILSWALLWSLQKGIVLPSSHVLFPLIDFTLVLVGFQLIRVRLGDEDFIRHGMLTVLAMCALNLLLSGALRLSREASLWSAGLAFLLVFWFSTSLDAVTPSFGVQASALAMAGALSVWLAGVMRTAMQTQVQRSLYERLLPGAPVPTAVGTTPELLTPRRLTVTVLSAEIDDFFEHTASLSADDAVVLANVAHTALVRAIREQGGVPVANTGAGVRAVFGLPGLPRGQAARAIAAAEAMVEAVAAIERPGPPLVLRVGIATGQALVGPVGDRDVLDLPPMGAVADKSDLLRRAASRTGYTVLLDDAALERAVRTPDAVAGLPAVESIGPVDLGPQLRRVPVHAVSRSDLALGPHTIRL